MYELSTSLLCWLNKLVVISPVPQCRLLFYAEYNKQPTLSANNSSDTSSLDTHSFSIISFIKNQKKNRFRESALKSLFYTNYKLVVLQCWLQRRARFVLKTEQIHTFLYIVSKLKGIFKKAKNHFRQPLVTCIQHTYFSLCGCPTFLCRRLKISHKIRLNMGWHIKVFRIMFSFTF